MRSARAAQRKVQVRVWITGADYRSGVAVTVADQRDSLSRLDAWEQGSRGCRPPVENSALPVST